ncbi:MAG: lipid-binding SYLF domain-containing protein [Limisphaerales bacterium]
MKTTILGLALMISALSASAVEKRELMERIHNLGLEFTELEQQSDKAVPADVLRRARGIVLLDRTKAGLIFAYAGGEGVAMVRDPQTDHWGPVAFVKANQASLGFQAGAEHNFIVLLLMTTNSSRFLTEPNFDFGAEVRGTAGDVTSTAGSVSAPERPVLIYTERSGLYGGAAIRGGAISPDIDANRAYYNRYDISMTDLLFGRQVQPTEEARNLAKTIDSFAKPEHETAGR